jgi:hypothetical protein
MTKNTNPWISFLNDYRKSHPNLSLSEAMTEASKIYKKKNSVKSKEIIVSKKKSSKKINNVEKVEKKEKKEKKKKKEKKEKKEKKDNEKVYSRKNNWIIHLQQFREKHKKDIEKNGWKIGEVAKRAKETYKK